MLYQASIVGLAGVRATNCCTIVREIYQCYMQQISTYVNLITCLYVKESCTGYLCLTLYDYNVPQLQTKNITCIVSTHAANAVNSLASE